MANTYNFTNSANGVLTLHVIEDGTNSGTPIVEALRSIILTDANYSNLLISGKLILTNE